MGLGKLLWITRALEPLNMAVAGALFGSRKAVSRKAIQQSRSSH